MSQILHVTRAELFKVSRRRRFYVFAILSWLLPPVIMLAIAWTAHINISDDVVGIEGGVNTIVQFIGSPATMARVSLSLVTQFAGFLTLFIAALGALLIGEERSQKMWKTTLIAAPSRVAVMTGKLLAGMMVLLALFLGMLVSCLAIGGFGTLFLPTTFGTDWGGILYYYALQWAFCLAMLSFAYLMMRLIHNNVIAVVGVLLIPPIIQSLYGIYTLLTNIDPIKNRFLAALEVLQLRNLLDQLPIYFLTNNFVSPSRLAILNMTSDQQELLDEFQNALTEGPFAQFMQLEPQQAAIVMGVYTLIFGGILYLTFSRSDIS